MNKSKGSIDEIKEAIERIILMLEDLINRVNRIESFLTKIGLNPDEAGLALNLSTLLSLPLNVAYEASVRTWKVLSKSRGLDPVSVAIVQALSTCNFLSISETYRRVRAIRGKASRRIVASKLRILAAAGIVAEVERGRRRRYVLAECIEENKGVHKNN